MLAPFTLPDASAAARSARAATRRAEKRRAEAQRSLQSLQESTDALVLSVEDPTLQVLLPFFSLRPSFLARLFSRPAVFSLLFSPLLNPSQPFPALGRCTSALLNVFVRRGLYRPSSRRLRTWRLSIRPSTMTSTPRTTTRRKKSCSPPSRGGLPTKHHHRRRHRRRRRLLRRRRLRRFWYLRQHNSAFQRQQQHAQGSCSRLCQFKVVAFSVLRCYNDVFILRYLFVFISMFRCHYFYIIIHALTDNRGGDSGQVQPNICYFVTAMKEPPSPST